MERIKIILLVLLISGCIISSAITFCVEIKKTSDYRIHKEKIRFEKDSLEVIILRNKLSKK